MIAQNFEFSKIVYRLVVMLNIEEIRSFLPGFAYKNPFFGTRMAYTLQITCNGSTPSIITTQNKSRMQTEINQWLHKKRNDTIRHGLEIFSVNETIIEYKNKLKAYSERMDEYWIPKGHSTSNQEVERAFAFEDYCNFRLILLHNFVIWHEYLWG